MKVFALIDTLKLLISLLSLGYLSALDKLLSKHHPQLKQSSFDSIFSPKHAQDIGAYSTVKQLNLQNIAPTSFINFLYYSYATTGNTCGGTAYVSFSMGLNSCLLSTPSGYTYLTANKSTVTAFQYGNGIGDPCSGNPTAVFSIPIGSCEGSEENYKVLSPTTSVFGDLVGEGYTCVVMIINKIRELNNDQP